MSFEEAAVLRRRAGRLREAVERFEHARALQLAAGAGVDTWQGPGPAHCVADYLDARRRLVEAGVSTELHASRLEWRARELEESARVHGS